MDLDQMKVAIHGDYRKKIAPATGIERLLAVIALTAKQWAEAGCKFQLGKLKSGADALFMHDDEWGWRVVISESVEMTTRLIISEEELFTASKLPSVFMDGAEIGEAIPRMVSVLPMTVKGEIKPITVTIGKEVRTSLVLPVLPMAKLIARVPELAADRAGVSGFMLIDPMLAGIVDAANILTRQEGFFEGQLVERCFRIGKMPGLITKIYPRKFPGRDGKPVTIFGDMSNLLLGKKGVIRHLRDIRVPGGASLVLLTAPELVGSQHFDHCFVPKRWADKLKLSKGDYVAISRRPSCTVCLVKIIGFSEKALCLNPVLIKKALLSDCDGDLIQAWPLRKDIPVGNLMASSVFGEYVDAKLDEGESLPTGVSYHKTDHVDEALVPHAGNKLRMGAISSIRFVLSLHNEFQFVDLGKLAFDELPYMLHMGRALERSKAPVSAFSDLLYRLAEWVINKHTGSTERALIAKVLQVLDLAHTEPVEAWQELQKMGGPLADCPDRIAEWCEYLHTLPNNASGYFKHPPVEKALHENPARLDLDQVMSVLDSDMFRQIR